ncbi:hypothetical protein ANN_24113 [Periplaneta americana]|uniref:Uncharacterized protein n=1 Tax=Periplaneta americana TaxID=6978 RepID=A0ABQ8S264_PERAM|nr:hypothetical protein ANN_24113 [Periplaneta americana]
MSPGSSTESYPAFARIGLKENPGKISTSSFEVSDHFLLHPVLTCLRSRTLLPSHSGIKFGHPIATVRETGAVK